MSARLKKGGRARWVLEAVGNGASVEVPVGFFVEYIKVESVDKVGSGEIGVGTTTSVVETATFTVTEGAVTQSGDITVGGVTIAVTKDDTAEEVATIIGAESYTGWTVAVDGADVTFTATGAGNKTNITASGGSTGVTFSAVTTVAGTQSVDVVTSVELPASGLNTLTLLKTAFTDDQNLYFSFTNESTANVYVGIQKYD